jgi:hypothetical protein
MKRTLTMAAATLLLGACADSPAAPVSAPLGIAGQPSLSSGVAESALDYTDQANDIITRVLPSFDDPAAAQTVRESMLALSTHAAAGELAEARAASKSARDALGAGAASALVLGAVSATLDVIDRDLASTDASPATSQLAN